MTVSIIFFWRLLCFRHLHPLRYLTMSRGYGSCTIFWTACDRAYRPFSANRLTRPSPKNRVGTSDREYANRAAMGGAATSRLGPIKAGHVFMSPSVGPFRRHPLDKKLWVLFSSIPLCNALSLALGSRCWCGLCSAILTTYWRQSYQSRPTSRRAGLLLRPGLTTTPDNVAFPRHSLPECRRPHPLFLDPQFGK